MFENFSFKSFQRPIFYLYLTKRYLLYIYTLLYFLLKYYPKFLNYVSLLRSLFARSGDVSLNVLLILLMGYFVTVNL